MLRRNKQLLHHHDHNNRFILLGRGDVFLTAARKGLGFFCRFPIEGGSDAPMLYVRPRLKEPNSKDPRTEDIVVLTADFLPWSHRGTWTARALSKAGHIDIGSTPLTFSKNLDLFFMRRVISTAAELVMKEHVTDYQSVIVG